MKLIFPWPGGKRRLAKHILPVLDVSHRTYVEPFAGAAAVFFMRPEPAPIEVLNDINGEIVRLYRCVQHHLVELCRQFQWALTSREMFRWANLQDVETLTDIQRAARFFYLQKLAFGAKSTGRTFGASPINPKRLSFVRIEDELLEAHMRLANVVVEHLSWEECIRRYDTPATQFYLDPPYWQTAGYGVPFGIEQYELMADLMRSIAGRAVVSINDHPDIRRIFDGFQMQELQTTYTIGSGAKPANELLIINK